MEFTIIWFIIIFFPFPPYGIIQFKICSCLKIQIWCLLSLLLSEKADFLKNSGHFASEWFFGNTALITSSRGSPHHIAIELGECGGHGMVLIERKKFPPFFSFSIKTTNDPLVNGESNITLSPISLFEILSISVNICSFSMISKISMILSVFSWFPFVGAFLRSFSGHFFIWDAVNQKKFLRLWTRT